MSNAAARRGGKKDGHPLRGFPPSLNSRFPLTSLSESDGTLCVPTSSHRVHRGTGVGFCFRRCKGMYGRWGGCIPRYHLISPLRGQLPLNGKPFGLLHPHSLPLWARGTIRRMVDEVSKGNCLPSVGAHTPAAAGVQRATARRAALSESECAPASKEFSILHPQFSILQQKNRPMGGFSLDKRQQLRKLRTGEAALLGEPAARALDYTLLHAQSGGGAPVGGEPGGI